jgi:glucose-6-phosphate isomerase
MSPRLRCDEAPAWQSLHDHFESTGRHFDVRVDLAQDGGRFEHFSQQAPYVFADLSKNRVDRQAESLLMELARQCGLESHRDAMFSGQAINTTEHRAVMHFLLRNQSSKDARQIFTGPVLDAAMPDVNDTLARMLDFAEAVRSDTQITDIVNIGIGGSDLGPQMAVLALQPFALLGKRFHFVSNVDGDELGEVLDQVQPQSTLFLIASKTFTTLETMANAQSARDWFLARGGTDVARHFAALTTNLAAADKFGIKTSFGFHDWVGGRYSLWSAIGLPVAIAVGAAGFRQMLSGAHEMDLHFAHAPLESNLPVRLGLLDVWYRNFHGFSSRSVAPYHHGLRRLPAYLQQLEMESNGKSVDFQGRPVPFETSPVVWGEPGTNGQHAFFQMIHQGTEVVPVEFIVARQPASDLPGHHGKLVANALAQAQALLMGRHDAGGHRHFSGNRPSSFLVIERMTPAALGALIAMYEHRVFVSGSIWGINSFDQWGVELGKQLAQDIQPRLFTGDVEGLDASTAGLLLGFLASE